MVATASTLTRRQLATAAVAGGVGIAVPSWAAAAESASQAWDATYDVIVVGMGAAGCAAAIEAHAAGSSVCVLEKCGRGGGSTFRSGGLIYMGGGTALQKRLGVEDTPEDMRAYVEAAVGVGTDQSLLDVFLDHSVELFDWCEAHGMVFDGDVDSASHVVEAPEGISLIVSGNERAVEYAALAKPAARGHSPRDGAMGIFEPLEAEVEGFAEVCYNTPVTGLVADETGRVVGVRATNAEGAELSFGAVKGVILACGAFAHNDAMVADYCSEALLCGRRTGFEENVGDGIRMAQRIGAATRSTERMNVSQFLYMYGDLAAGALLDENGMRMIAEDSYGTWIGRTVFRSSPRTAFVIVDSLMRENIAATPYGAALEPVAEAETLEELFEAVGLPAQNALASLERYNDCCAAGDDGEFHKDPEYLKPVSQAPFFAFNANALNCSFTTLGGLKIDAGAHVVNIDGMPIEGLYAAGRTSCGIFGEYFGSGCSIADCLIFGRIAGANAAQLI